MIRKQTKLWTTREKQKIRICDMSDSHLLNTIRMVKRVAIREKAEQTRLAWSFASMMHGDMASYFAEQECDSIDRAHWSDERFATDFWEPLMLDAERRGGAVWKQAQAVEWGQELRGVERV